MFSFGGKSRNGQFCMDVLVRLFLAVLFVQLEKGDPFIRKIHPEELWLYKNPVTPSYIPSQLLWPIVVFIPLAFFCVVYFFKRDKADVVQGLLALSFALVLNGVVTTLVKLIVGRPRPDFFWRCFPDGVSNQEMMCTGNAAVVAEGRKSFPSGHSSFAFASLGFISIYIAGLLGVFNQRGRGYSLRALAFLLPLLFALCIALSRTCDYHHHWQDVLVGSLLGLGISYFTYRQYYPALSADNAGVAFAIQTIQTIQIEKIASDL